MTPPTLQLPEDLFAELQQKAAAEGKSVNEVAAEALRKGLNDLSWQELLEYGRERGRSSGYDEEDIPAVVKSWRREQRSR